MTNFDGPSRSLSQRIIEISDLISRNAKLLQNADFQPDEAFVSEQRRLIEECKRVAEDLSRQQRGRNLKSDNELATS